MIKEFWLDETYPEYVRLYGGDACDDEAEQERSLRGAVPGERQKWPKSDDGNVYVPYVYLSNVCKYRNLEQSKILQNFLFFAIKKHRQNFAIRTKISAMQTIWKMWSKSC